jgi:hypothetical protein
MTYRFYKRFQIIFYILFIPSLLFGQFGNELVRAEKHPFFWLIICLAFPILSITLLYFGIYAHLCGIKTSRKIDGPITLIVLGSIFTFLSFGPAIASYFFIPEEIFEPVSSAELRTLRESAIDINKQAEKRLLSAIHYYVKTGKTIEYFDDNGKKKIYFPNKSVEEWRDNHIKHLKKAKQMASATRINIISHISIALVLAAVFFGFVWRNSKRKKE